MMNMEALHKILAMYGINNADILPMQIGYRNQNYPIRYKNINLNLIIYKNEPGILMRIKNANKVADSLANDLPVRRTYDPRIVSIQSGTVTKYCSLYYYLPGKTIAWEAYTMEHIKTLGGMLSTLHHKLQGLNINTLPKIDSELRHVVTRMSGYFNDKGVETALNSKLSIRIVSKRLDEFNAILDLCSVLPGQQALHMDFVRGNILFDGTTITGILDFEKTAFGHPMYDVARTLAFLLIDCKYKSEAQVRKYFLQSGYNKRGYMKLELLKINGKQVLEELLNIFLVHDFYKFLRHNPYESLESNEHFVRTRTFLLERGLITAH